MAGVLATLLPLKAPPSPKLAPKCLLISPINLNPYPPKLWSFTYKPVNKFEVCSSKSPFLKDATISIKPVSYTHLTLPTTPYV